MVGIQGVCDGVIFLPSGVWIVDQVQQERRVVCVD